MTIRTLPTITIGKYTLTHQQTNTFQLALDTLTFMLKNPNFQKGFRDSTSGLRTEIALRELQSIMHGDKEDAADTGT